jgi:hypothetical protein
LRKLNTPPPGEVTVPSTETLERFIARVESNAHADAVEEFYTEDASMRENLAPPRVGRQMLVENEKRVLANAKSVVSKCIRPVLAQDSVVVIRWYFRFEAHDGTVRELEELAYQEWRGERIFREQFFYDPQQFLPKKMAPDAA